MCVCVCARGARGGESVRCELIVSVSVSVHMYTCICVEHNAGIEPTVCRMLMGAVH